MKASPASLAKRLQRATGPDDHLDKAIAAMFPEAGGNPDTPAYTASVDACIALIKHVCPHWHWHVGHGPTGIVPYASMTEETKSEDGAHVEATAPTVPLALLRVLFKALDSTNG